MSGEEKEFDRIFFFVISIVERILKVEVRVDKNVDW